MAEETIMDKITELMKIKTDEICEEDEKECKNIQNHIINNWIKKKQSKKTAKRNKQKIT